MANYRLNESMESRIHREVYVRFGGELSKSRHSNMKMGVGSLAYVINTVGNIFSGQVVGETANDFIRAFWKSAPKAPVYFHQSSGCLYVHQYPNGQSHPTEQD